VKAHIGDHLVVESRTTETARREGEIISVHGSDGAPPYEVKWYDNGHVSTVFPGPDAHVTHPAHTSPR